MSAFPIMKLLCHKTTFLQEAARRGYAEADVMASVVGMQNDFWTIDTAHPSYPRLRETAALANSLAAAGPGTELKALLKGWFGIQATPNCSCNARAMEMDRRGVEWCESQEGMTTILGWLREEAGKRGLPFVELGAKILVRRAISAAKKKQKDTK